MSDAPPPPFPPGATPPPPGHQPPPPMATPPPPGHQPPPPQPGFAPQPGYGQGSFAPPAPKKKSRWWIWVLAVLFVLALLMGGCSLLVYRAVSGPIDAANNMLGLLEAGDIEDAKDELDFDCFGNDGLDTFEEFFTANPVVSYDLTTTANLNGAGEATGSITLRDGLGNRPISLSLSNDDGWKVCGIDIDEP